MQEEEKGKKRSVFYDPGRSNCIIFACCCSSAAVDGNSAADRRCYLAAVYRYSAAVYRFSAADDRLTAAGCHWWISCTEAAVQNCCYVGGCRCFFATNCCTFAYWTREKTIKKRFKFRVVPRGVFGGGGDIRVTCLPPDFQKERKRDKYKYKEEQRRKGEKKLLYIFFLQIWKKFRKYICR